MIGRTNFITTNCGCPCHGAPGISTPAFYSNHPGQPCWCYEPQEPVVIQPPTFCPHCGKKLPVGIA